MRFDRRSRGAFVLGALCVALTGTRVRSKERTKVAGPAVFYGYANTIPAPWLEKHPHEVTVTFCVRGTEAPPSPGSPVTLVPADDRLPTVVTRVAKAKKRDGGCLPVTVEPVLLDSWRGAWAVGAAWSKYPRLLVVSGEHPEARPLGGETLPSDALPAGTKSENVRIAIDIDGDGKVDAIACCACPEGTCDECTCQEVWVRSGDRWQRRAQFCED